MVPTSASSGALLARAWRPGVLVGLCVDRDFEMVEAMLGILKPADASLPLNPSRSLAATEESGAGAGPPTSQWRGSAAPQPLAQPQHRPGPVERLDWEFSSTQKSSALSGGSHRAR